MQQISTSADFSDLPRGLCAAIDACARIVAVRSGRSIVEPGVSSTEVYFVLSGSFRVTLFSPQGREVIFRDLQSGDIFGEYSAIDGSPRSATVLALEPSKLMAISSSDFIEFVHADRSHVEWLLVHLTHQLRNQSKKIFQLSALKARGRLHCELLRLAELGVREADGIVVEHAPTHSELAARIGSYRETVSREMSYLTKRSMLQLRHRTLTITNLAGIAGELAGQIDGRTGFGSI